ncbi:MAG: 3-deoxy-D-manno-octulosonic acid transferase [Nitrospirae bacterium]|nr:3-deoxy-D-manno-octulosonic acid transferase [Nitrospirota bacterium]
MYLFYNLLLLFSFLVGLPSFFLGKMLFTGKYRKSFRQKFGFIPSSLQEKMVGSPCIWINAVSVGEVIAVSSLVKALHKMYPQACLIFSTGTETGQEMARKMVKEATAYIYYPLDLPWIVRRTLDIVNPDLFINTETELWPNFLRLAKKRGVKIILVNGRISVRSFSRYRKTAFFWRKVLDNLDVMSMISEIDAERIRAIGAKPERVFVNGNSKYDALAGRTEPRFEEELRKILKINEEEKVFIAASTHRGEEEIVLQAYKRFLEKFPGLLLIIIPRHIERVGEVEEIVKKEGVGPCIRRSRIEGSKQSRTESIIILDSIGELFKVYSLGTLVFCGGSFVPRGGQNIMEPAAWGKVVFYGPSMEDFLDAKELLERAGAGIPVESVETLIEKGLALLSQPRELKKRGEAGRKVVMSSGGAGQRNAELVRGLLK